MSTDRATPRILFVHGMYMTPLCWERWEERVGARGRACVALAWPGRDRPLEELRDGTCDESIAALTLAQVVDSVAAAAAAEATPPVLVGHSMGGLASQLVMQRVPLAAVVAISSAAPRGVLSAKPSFLKANWGHITPFRSKRHPVRMSFERFQYVFANDMPAAEQRAAYDRYVVPESRRVPAGALTATAKVDFARPHPPLLFVAGTDDNVIPASLVRTNARRYRRSPREADLVELPDRNHLLLAQPGWEHVVDEVLDWLGRADV